MPKILRSTWPFHYRYFLTTLTSRNTRIPCNRQVLLCITVFSTKLSDEIMCFLCWGDFFFFVLSLYFGKRPNLVKSQHSDDNPHEGEKTSWKLRNTKHTLSAQLQLRQRGIACRRISRISSYLTLYRSSSASGTSSPRPYLAITSSTLTWKCLNSPSTQWSSSFRAWG